MSKVKLIMVKLCAVCLCCAYAEVEIDASYKSEEVDGVRWYYSIDENGRVELGAKDVEGNVMPAISENTVGDITIPSVLGGSIVDRIGDRAFMDCNQITSVTMSDSVKSIGSHAFRHCTQLQDVRMSPNITSLGEYAFHDCPSLTGIIIPNGVSTIERNTFYGCDSLTDITIPEGVVSIGRMAFYSCGLENITLFEGVTTIGVGAFFECKVKEVVIPTSVTNIEAQAFSYCESLTSVIIKGSPCLGRRAFEWCASLKSVCFLSEIKGIGDGVFTGCTSIKEMEFSGTIPEGIENSGLSGLRVYYVCPRESVAKLKSIFSKTSVLQNFYQPNRPLVEYVGIKVRENNPTILDCVYRVRSKSPTVKVRALAFKDGVRSFANVVRPETFIEGTAANVGDAVAANTELKLSWQVSADWDIDLAKVKFEILATEDDLLPLELRTVPANGSNKAMELSWNLITEKQCFDALLWLYAEGDTGLTLVDGALFESATKQMLAYGGSCSGGYITNPSGKIKEYLGVSGSVVHYSVVDSTRVIFSRMGFSRLSGSDLTYAKTMTRLELVPDGARQYAYRWIED